MTVTLASSAVLDRVRSIAGELASRAADYDRDGSFPAESIGALWDAGLGNLTLAAEHGGEAADLLSTSRAVRLVGAANAATALIWVMHLIHLKLLAESGFGFGREVREAVFASSLAGPALINSLRVEPELGTPARGGVPATRAVLGRGPDGEPAWLLSGHKIYCTGSPGLRWLLVWAATGSEDPDGVRIGPFLVESTAPGIEIRETWDHLGMRASASHDVIFTATPVPLTSAPTLEPLGSPSAGLRDPLTVGWMSVLLSSIYLGVATAARDWLTGYLTERTPANLGAPLASLPRFQAAVGGIEALHVSSVRLLDGLAGELDAGGARAACAAGDAGLVKVVVSRNVVAICEQALALCGNPGLSYTQPLQRHYRDALCSRIHTPQEDAVLEQAGRRAIDLDRTTPTK